MAAFSPGVAIADPLELCPGHTCAQSRAGKRVVLSFLDHNTGKVTSTGRRIVLGNSFPRVQRMIEVGDGELCGRLKIESAL